MSDVYDEDFVLWTEQQAELLRRRAAGRLTTDIDLDWLNLAEEIEAAGHATRRDLRSRSWRATIPTQRQEIEDLLATPLPARQVAGVPLRRLSARPRRHARRNKPSQSAASLAIHHRPGPTRHAARRLKPEAHRAARAYGTSCRGAATPSSATVPPTLR